MAFTAKDVQALREKTGCGMMDCKNALQSSDGDMDKAIEFLREKGMAAATKKAGRIAAEGIVTCITSADLSKSVILEVNAETDFVAKNEAFIAFVNQVGETILANDVTTVEEIEALKPAGSDLTVAEILREKILAIGENMKIRRFVKMEGLVYGYVHTGNRIAALVKLDTAIDADKARVIAKNIALHVTMYSPTYIAKSDVSDETVENEKKILMAQAMEEGKPEAIAEKMVAGRIQKFYKEICLLEQGYIMDEDISVAKYLDNAGKETGGTVAVAQFVRFEKGEGIEKREDNFADEVASMIK